MVAGLVAAAAAHAGTYYMPFDLPDQLLPFDIFGNPPATVLAPAGVYQGSGSDTVMQILGGNLVASDPSGGIVGEYSALALVAGPPDNQFTNGATVRTTIAASTVESVRDGLLPGLAVGITLVDTDDNTYLFGLINRTTAGADYFDNITLGGMANESSLTPGTGYVAVWQAGITAAPTVLASLPIPAGALPNMQLEVAFDSSGVASYKVNGASLYAGHTLAAQPDRAGIVVMSWGPLTGNPAYSGVTFGSLREDGPEIQDGGDPLPLPAVQPVTVAALLLAILFTGVRGLRKAL